VACEIAKILPFGRTRGHASLCKIIGKFIIVKAKINAFVDIRVSEHKRVSGTFAHTSICGIVVE
jgi:hypothetical protein